MGERRSVVVESGRDEGEQDTNTAVGGIGNTMEVLEDPDCLVTIRALFEKIKFSSDMRESE